MKLNTSKFVQPTIALFGVLLLPVRPLAGTEHCEKQPVEVTGQSSHENRLVCSAAGDALRLLARCEISARRPLQVDVVPEVRHPLGASILGHFDIRQQKVRIVEEAKIHPLIQGTPYANLPRRDFFRSLVVHEVVHAVMHQNLKRSATSHAAYEYPAYALQIESLPPKVREQFLQSFEQPAIHSDHIFNDAVLMFDPYFFAARAYSHLKAAADHCANLNALLEGEVPFILALPMQ